MIIRFRVLVIIADRCPAIDQEPLNIDVVRKFSVDGLIGATVLKHISKGSQPQYLPIQ